MNKNTRSPLFHVAKRGALPWYHAWAVRGAALLLALVICGIITSLVTKLNPLSVYAAIWKGSFGTSRKFWVLLQNIAMLLCVALAVTPAFRMRCWNLGAEGQALIGALASAACMILLPGKIPNWAVIVCMAVTSIAAGAIWAGIPAFFKAKWNTNETLFTLMMNYVATQLVAYYCVVWESPKGSATIGIINSTTEIGWFPVIGGQKYLLNILIVAVTCVAMFVYLRYSKHGYEIAVVGESER
ncbi:MAG: ABC transporter permease, partial [Oscillospiraceae bacterium]|nr:ABC transporter permease [Oscillospiraceae bacterium]